MNANTTPSAQPFSHAVTWRMVGQSTVRTTWFATAPTVAEAGDRISSAWAVDVNRIVLLTGVLIALGTTVEVTTARQTFRGVLVGNGDKARVYRTDIHRTVEVDASLVTPLTAPPAEGYFNEHQRWVGRQV